MSEDKKKGILLESGTNELEIVEFCVESSHYGMNIAKVREIIKSDIDIVPVPDSHPSIEGAINLRGRIIPIINLAKYLNVNIKYDKKINRIIIAEFNQLLVGFLVSSVAKIHRISWKDVEQPSDMIKTDEGYTVGVVRINECILFLLDFEKIAGQINPRASMSAHSVTPVDLGDAEKQKRASKVILVAEDSEFIRKAIVDNLKSAGYKTVTASNGEQAYSYVDGALKREDFEQIDDHINLLITDIEMPQMDGLHLIKKIKQNQKTRKLPCVAFSSMICTELVQKCKAVGSDAEIAKPDIARVVEIVDNLVI